MSCAHAFKPVSRRPVSFVAAVTKWGDCWSAAIPLFHVGREEQTQDVREFYSMCAMEVGKKARVDMDPAELNAYPPIVVTSCSRYLPLSAYREGYEPGCLTGHGDTKAEAIADLVQQECELKW